MRPSEVSRRITVHSMNTSMPWATARFWRVRIISRPVRSNSAPHSSSSKTRSGASWAWSWAIRQLLSILPPRMVSRKCTRQLSSGYTLPMAAAMPPSAMTVWALPSSDLQTRAVRAPRSLASMAARRPAPPAPMTTTSNSWVSCSAMDLEHQPRVAENTAGHQPHIDVGEGHEDQADPGQRHVAGVEDRHLAPRPVPDRVAGEVVEPPPAQVPAGVAGQRVQPQEEGVDQQHHRAQADAPALGEVEGPQGVPGQDDRERQGQVEEVAVDVLEDEGEAGLAGVAGPGVGDGAGRRRQPERPVVRLAVVVAGQPEPERERQHQQRRGQSPPVAEDRPGRLLAVAGQTGRVERRQVRVGPVVAVGEGHPGAVDDEQAQDRHRDQRLQPPPVLAQGPGPDPGPVAVDRPYCHAVALPWVVGQRGAVVAAVTWVTGSLKPRRSLVGRSAASQRERRPGRVDRITSSNSQRCRTTRTASTGSATPISPETLAPSSRIASSCWRIRSRASRRPRSSPDSPLPVSSSSSSSSWRASSRSDPSSSPASSATPPAKEGSSCPAGVAGTTRWKWQSPPPIRSRMTAHSSSPPSVWLATTRYRRMTPPSERDKAPSILCRDSPTGSRGMMPW